MHKIESVGIVGSGTMGLGIAQVCALHGFEVHMTDISPTLVAKGVDTISERLAREVSRGRMTQDDSEAAANRVKAEEGIEDLANCDLVIEAIVESLESKLSLFQRLGAICKPEAVLASNTSSLSISQLAGASGRPASVLGMHFFNPPSALHLLELTTTPQTDASKTAAVEAFCEALNREVVRVKDTPGFIVNRLLIPFIFDAVRLADTGVAEPADIDIACKSGLGHSMGPLATADLIGLDTLVQIGNALFEDFGEPRFKPPVILGRMVSLGNLGRKSGTGFFQYRGS